MQGCGSYGVARVAMVVLSGHATFVCSTMRVHMLLYNLLSLGLQIPSKKVSSLLKTPKSTFLEGIWSPRVYNL